MAEIVDGIRIASPTSCRRLEGKNAIVTAATLGIGRAIAQRLAQEGANVVICSRKQKNVDDCVLEFKRDANLTIKGFACNLAEVDGLSDFVTRAIEYFKGRIDVLVSNVGINPQAGNALDMDIAVYDKIMNTNVRSHWLLVKGCRPAMSSGASVILISSVGGMNPEYPISIYGMSKTALIGLGRALAGELAASGIRINTICPGVVRTKFAKMLWDGPQKEVTSKNVAMQRHADPVEMAGLAAFLASNESSFITGESFVASGGTGTRL